MRNKTILRTLWLWALLIVAGNVWADVKTLTLSDGVLQEDGSYLFTLEEGDYTTYGTTVFKGKTLVFNGTGIGKTIWHYGKDAAASGEGGSDYSFENGSNVTFRNLTLKDNYNVNSYYRGFVRPKSMHFENCEFLNMAGYFGDSNSDGVWFKDCVFNVNAVCEYCVKTYGGSDFYFDNCTFNAKNKGFIQLYIQDNSKTHNVTINNCTFNKAEGNTATLKTAVYWYNYNGSSEGADWNVFFSGDNVNNAGIQPNTTSGTWMYEWKYTNTASVYNNGVCVMNEGVAQTITEDIVPSSVTQTTVDIDVTQDETASEASTTDIEAAITSVVANTTTVNSGTTVGTIAGVTSTKNYLHIDVKAAEVAKAEETTYVKSMTFDVKPIAATITDGKLTTEVIPNDKITSAITFRLPVDANATETFAEVFHNGVPMGSNYQVQGTTEKYIEVSTTSFSEFSYQLLNAPGGLESNGIYILTDDQTSFAVTEEKPTASVSYTRTFNGNLETLYLPFDYDLTADDVAALEFGQITGITKVGEDDAIEYTKLASGTTLTANTPYFVKKKEITSEPTYTLNTTGLKRTEQTNTVFTSSNRKYVFTGVYENIQLTGKPYWAIDNNGNMSYASNAGSYIVKPFRLVMRIYDSSNNIIDPHTSSSAKTNILILSDDEATGIREIHNAESNDSNIYDLSGRRVTTPVHGLYISNGKKIMVK